MGTTTLDGFPAFDIVTLNGGLVNGVSYASKLSTVDNVQITAKDATYTPGTANCVWYTLSDRTVTLAVRGFTAGTADLMITGRL